MFAEVIVSNMYAVKMRASYQGIHGLTHGHHLRLVSLDFLLEANTLAIRFCQLVFGISVLVRRAIPAHAVFRRLAELISELFNSGL